MKRGDTLVVPWAAGAVKVEGHIELLRCLPPLPVDAAKDDPGSTRPGLGRRQDVLTSSWRSGSVSPTTSATR